MPYEKKLWQDRIKDAQGNIIQEGTPFSAGNMNRIEQGIYDAHQMLDKQNQQSVTIGHGLNVINTNQNSPLDIRIEGRTLVNVSQNILDPAKYYVLSDKKSKVKFGDGTTYSGVAKFAGRAEKPILIRVENFEGKVAGSTAENPHISKVTANSSLVSPTSFGSEVSQAVYDKMKTQNNDSVIASNSNIGNMMQHLFSFNLIEAVERTLGKIPASDKVTWLKNNINALTIRWHGYGTSPTGNKASLAVYNNTTSTWVDTVNHTNGTVTQLSFTISGAAISDRIDANGFIHFLAYAEPSNGTVASTIYTDYIELETELNQNAQLWNPRFPLYEVDATEYANILTVWDENEVMRRFPMVESVQHVQNPYVIAEGDNLLPPFTEWNLHANAVVREPYKLELNATEANQESNIKIRCLPNKQYTISVNTNSDRFIIDFFDSSGQIISGYVYNADNRNGGVYTFTTPSNAIEIRVRAYSSSAGTFTFTNPMLTLGSIAKPFVPRNPSYLFAEIKLGALSDKKDILWKDGQDWKVTRWIEKDVNLGSINWAFSTDGSGFKRVVTSVITPSSNNQMAVVTKFDGKTIYNDMNTNAPTTGDVLKFYQAFSVSTHLTVFDNDSGWGENYTPTSDEIKAYFYGWRMCNGTYGVPYDGTGTKTWYPIGDTDLSRATTTCPTSAAPTIAEGKISYYKLSYVRSTPVTEVVTDKVEGDLVVNGATQVEVGSGIVVREKITPAQRSSDGYWLINEKGLDATITDTPLKNRTNDILFVYRNQIRDNKWIILKGTNNRNGGAYARIPNADFDPTAEYTVTYLLLDRQSFTTNILAVTATYDSSLKSVVDSVVAKQSDIAAQVSVNVRAIAELYKRIKALGG